MKLKTVCLLFFCVLLFLLLKEISCIANYQHEQNLLTEEDRRAAEKEPDQVKAETYHQIYSGGATHQSYGPTAPHERHHVYPSDYGASAASFSSPGYAIYSHGGGYSSGYPAPSGHGVSGYGFAHGGGGGGGGGGVGGHHGGGHSGLALKGLLIPLAGIALLGAAAALSTNPVLLQLGVLNGRKRRSVPSSNVYPANPRLSPRK